MVSARHKAHSDSRLFSPLCVLYHARVIAFGTVALVIALLDNVTLAQGLSAAAELGERFDLAVEYSEEGMIGEDAHLVQGATPGFTHEAVLTIAAFCQDFLEYCRMGLIDRALVDLVDVSVFKRASGALLMTDGDGFVGFPAEIRLGASERSFRWSGRQAKRICRGKSRPTCLMGYNQSRLIMGLLTTVTYIYDLASPQCTYTLDLAFSLSAMNTSSRLGHPAASDPAGWSRSYQVGRAGSGQRMVASPTISLSRQHSMH